MTNPRAGRIPATIVTGFLGAGKTTLIRHMLAHAGERRIALIINEFGDLGVDGEILKGCGDATCREEDIVELSNGCICCTVADDFLPMMETLLARPDRPDHIVIETSGLALPQPLVRAFNWPGIATKVTVDGVVVLVDGPAVAAGRFAHDHAALEAQREADGSIDHETPLSELFEDQLACADMIVVSKSDLMGEAEAAALAETLAAGTRPGVQVVKASHGALPAEVLLGVGAAAEADMEGRAEVHHGHEGEHHEHDHDEFESFTVDLGEVPDPAALTRRLAEVITAHDILRLKGFAAVAGKPMRLAVQAVGPRVESYFDRPFGTDPRAGRLVVIGLAGLDRAAITSAIASIAAPAPAAAPVPA
ncbi:cobalamin biosynthesis protein CobW [Pseudoroseicyclus sp. CXY001]|uniref:cobalamin biosynthesis protein CobW n=1 Tax=Pseudoroseicyclus sp. CXY001 TaxID=3242492 RepID=UPI00358DB613